MLLAFANALPASADKKAEALVVEMTDGSTVTFKLEEQPKLTFSGTNLVIESAVLETSYPLSDLKRYTFKFVEASGIDTVEGNGTGVKQADGSITIDGITPGTAITVYSTSGTAVATAKAGGTGSATISTSPLPSGVYIIKYGDKTTKIRKP